MKVPLVARVASRLCFCRVVLRYAVEDSFRGTHRPHYVKSSRDATNASGLYSAIDKKAPGALAYICIPPPHRRGAIEGAKAAPTNPANVNFQALTMEK